MKVRDIFNFDNERYAALRDPARAVSAAYLNGNRYLDTAKEYVYTEQGLVHCSAIIHAQAHAFLERLDVFGDLLHERHLMQEYPATPELDWREELKSLDDVFGLIVRVLDAVQEGLEEFHAVTDNAAFRPMALKTEELMAQNSADYTRFMEMAFRWQTDGGSLTSFDSWCARLENAAAAKLEEDD